MSDYGLLADTGRLLPKHGLALEAGHAEKIAGRAQITNSVRENDHIPLILAVSSCLLDGITTFCLTCNVAP